ncbi:MAG: hypothetical protein WAP55_02970 [Minisyncoccia bacterium]
MKDVVYSDLSFSGVSLDIAVLSPSNCGEFTIEEVVERRRNWFPALGLNVCCFARMQHSGMLTCSGAHSSGQSQGEPLGFVRCGGAVRLDDDTIVCDRCAAAFRFLGNWGRQVKSIMFYLMLKQMVSDIRFCNFVDCSITLDSDRFAGNYARLAEIRSLGVVAVHRCLLYLSPGAGGVRHCGLGFVLAPNMRTRTEGPGKFGPWLQYLMYEWYRRVKGSEDDTREFRFGPKPVQD